MTNEMGFNNFKAFGEKIQTFSKKPITLIYGPNSVGKSSLIHLIGFFNKVEEVINDKYETTSLSNFDISILLQKISLGGIENFIHKKDSENKTIKLVSITDNYERILELRKSLSIGMEEYYLGISKIEYRKDNKLLLTMYVSEAGFKVELNFEHNAIKEFIKETKGEFEKNFKRKEKYIKLAKLQIADSDDIATKLVKDFCTELHNEFYSKNQNFEYIEPMRFYPERGEIPPEFDDTRIIYDLNDWFTNEKLNLPYEIDIAKCRAHKEDKNESDVFIDKRSNTHVHLREMGLGISQLIPVMAKIFDSRDSIIAIEQPELHLHPLLQMEIADEFIKSYKNYDNIFIIETHSEHLLLRIMKRMRHTAEDREGRDKTLDLTPDDVCLLYVDNNGEFTYINELELDDDGSLLDPWPNGFFEEGHKERFY